MQSPSPTIYLGHVAGAQGDNNLLRDRNDTALLPDQSKPAILVSFYYIKSFLKVQKDFVYRDWAMDSGAFSAYYAGVKIDLAEYIELCKKLIATDPTLVEIFSLDVIHDWRASAKNTERMWEAGIPAIPCYHMGEPLDALMEMSKTYPKIAVGGCARSKGKKKMEFARQVFARVWPKKIHGFGFGSKDQMLELPWHSTDSTNWELGPVAFGRWNTYGDLVWRGSNQNLRVEIEYFLKIERQARNRWAKEMALLDETDKNASVMRSGYVSAGYYLLRNLGSTPRKPTVANPGSTIRLGLGGVTTRTKALREGA